MNEFDKFEEKIILAPIDELQIGLTERFIEPNKTELYNYSHQFRKIFDLHIKQDLSFENFEFRQKHIDKLKNRKAYPIGGCYEITHCFFQFVAQEISSNKELQFLHDFINAGGVFKTIWGIVRNEVFQTAMQIGSLCLDVANDTVYLDKDKVLISDFEAIKFKNIESIKEYVHIKNCYHNVKMYPNTILPELAIFFPLLSIKDGQIHFDTSYTLTHLSIASRLQTYYDFIEKDAYEMDQVPDEYSRTILEAFKSNSDLLSNQREILTSEYSISQLCQLRKKLYSSIVLFNQMKKLKPTK